MKHCVHLFLSDLYITFKENFSDILNSKVIDIDNELIEYKMAQKVHDPWTHHLKEK